MDISNLFGSGALLSATPIYLALSGFLFAIFTLRVGLGRAKAKVSVGDGDNPELFLLIRGQANFVETVPLVLILVVAMELLGASGAWIHSLGSALILGRILHYIGLTNIGPRVFRPIGMIATLASVLVSSIWLLVAAF